MTYRKIDTQTWSDSSFLELSAEAKLSYIYLITAPQGDLSGCVECSAACLARDTGLTRDQAESALAELEAMNLVLIDQDTKEVLVKKFGAHQWSKSPKAQTATKKAISKIVSCPLREEAEKRLFDFLGIEYRYGIDRVPIEYPYSIDTVSDELSTEKNAGQIEYPYSIDTVSGSGTGSGNNPNPNGLNTPNPLQPKTAREPKPIPSLEEVKSFASWKGLLVDCEAFFEFYEKQGWKSQGEVIWDWQKLLESWAATQQKKLREKRKAERSSAPVYSRFPRCPNCDTQMYEDSKDNWVCFSCSTIISKKGKEVAAS